MRGARTAASLQLGELGRRVRLARALVTGGLHLTESDIEQMVEGIDDERASMLGHAWRVVSALGAPPTRLLDCYLEALDDATQRERQIRAAVAGPLVATRILLFLPAISVVFLELLGFDVVGVLVGGVMGWGCLALAGGFIALSQVWSRRLVATARRARAFPGFGLELVAVGVRSGASVSRVVECVTAELSRGGSNLAPEIANARGIAEQASVWGVPVANLMRATAQAERAAENERVALAVAALGEKILLPLGLCMLPAFISLVAVPAVLSTLSATSWR